MNQFLLPVVKQRRGFSVAVILILIFICMAALSASAREGGGSHGGDTLVFEFTGSAQNLSTALKKAGPIEGCPDADAFGALVNDPRTHYSSATLVTVPTDEGEIEVDARNWNDDDGAHIEISRVRISQIKNPEIFMALVLHEFFGLMGIEGTNDQHATRKCFNGLNALGREDLAPRNLVYHINPVSSIERSFIQGGLFFECNATDAPAGSSPTMRLRLQEKSFCTAGAFALALEARDEDGHWSTLGRSGCLPPATLEKLFHVQYSIHSGEGRFVLEAPNMRQVNSLNLSSADRVKWDLETNWSLQKTSGKFRGTCSPELLVR